IVPIVSIVVPFRAYLRGTFRNASAMTHRNARFRVWEERHDAKDSVNSACRKHEQLGK
ncbi:hypothetical protein AK812_SmicGene44906, partial [Symbiodinium microadriaticum]